MSVVLSDNQFEAVMTALHNAQHDLSFHHGLHVTDVNTSWDIYCLDTIILIDAAISELEKLEYTIVFGLGSKICYAL